MSKGRILIIEDEENIAKLVSLYLSKEDYSVDIASSGRAGLQKLEEKSYKVIILDLMLPDYDGFDVCRKIRKEKNTPIIMLTAKDTEIDKVVGLEIGADDYVTKPFSPRELTARIKAVLRRTAESEEREEVISVDQVTIDARRREVIVGESQVNLTVKEFDLLYYLAENKGIVLSRQMILSAVWGYDYMGDTRTVDVHVNQLRAKIDGGCKIATVWGVGYKIDDKI